MKTHELKIDPAPWWFTVLMGLVFVGVTGVLSNRIEVLELRIQKLEEKK